MWVRSLDESQRVNTVMCGQFRIHVFVSVCDGLRWEVLDTADGATVRVRGVRPLALDVDARQLRFRNRYDGCLPCDLAATADDETDEGAAVAAVVETKTRHVIHVLIILPRRR